MNDALKELFVEKKDFSQPHTQEDKKGLLLGKDFYVYDSYNKGGRGTTNFWEKSAVVFGDLKSPEVMSYKKANIAEMNASYLVADPEGKLLRSVGSMLKKNGYIIQVLDLTDAENSYKYNPIKNLFNEAHKRGDKFSTETNELAYMISNIGNLRRMISKSYKSEDPSYVLSRKCEDVLSFLIAFAAETIQDCTLKDVALLNNVCYTEPEKMFGEKGFFADQKKKSPNLACFNSWGYSEIARIPKVERMMIISALNSILEPYTKDSEYYGSKETNSCCDKSNEIILSRMGYAKMAIFVIPAKQKNNKLKNIIGSMIFSQACAKFNEQHQIKHTICIISDSSMGKEYNKVRYSKYSSPYDNLKKLCFASSEKDVAIQHYDIRNIEYKVFLGAFAKNGFELLLQCIKNIKSHEPCKDRFGYIEKEWQDFSESDDGNFPKEKMMEYVSKVDEKQCIIVSSDLDQAVVCPVIDFEKHVMYELSGDFSDENNYNYTEHLDEHIEYHPESNPEPEPKQKKEEEVRLYQLCKLLGCEPGDVAEKVLELLTKGKTTYGKIG